MLDRGRGVLGEVAERQVAYAHALGMRFVVRGLGPAANSSLTRLLTPGEHDTAQTVQAVEDLRQGIASMATELRAPQ